MKPAAMRHECGTCLNCNPGQAVIQGGDMKSRLQRRDQAKAGGPPRPPGVGVQATVAGTAQSKATIWPGAVGVQATAMRSRGYTADLKVGATVARSSRRHNPEGSKAAEMAAREWHTKRSTFWVVSRPAVAPTNWVSTGACWHAGQGKLERRSATPCHVPITLSRCEKRLGPGLPRYRVIGTMPERTEAVSRH